MPQAINVYDELLTELKIIARSRGNSSLTALVNEAIAAHFDLSYKTRAGRSHSRQAEREAVQLELFPPEDFNPDGVAAYQTTDQGEDQ